MVTLFESDGDIFIDDAAGLYPVIADPRQAAAPMTQIGLPRPVEIREAWFYPLRVE